MKNFLKKITAMPIWPRIWMLLKRFLNFVKNPLNTPRFHGFEIIAMRILFAVAVFQTMPLGPPFSNWAYEGLLEAKPEWFDEKGQILDAANKTFRPPLLPVMELLPIADYPPRDKSLKKPNGLAHLAPAPDREGGIFTSVRKIFDFTYFSDLDFVKTLRWFVIPALILYASGYGLPIALPVLVWVSIGSRTLVNSQGSIHHGLQMVSLVLLAQMLVVLWHCKTDWREAFGLRKPALRNGVTVWDQFIRHAQIIIVACYVIAGVIKPIRSEGEWFKNSHLIGIQFVKADRQNYYNDLNSERFNREPVPFAKEMMEKKNRSRIFMGAGVLLEIFAFLALFSRFAGLIMGVSLILFHLINEKLMDLYFYNNEKLVWIFFINIPFWIWWVWQKCRKKKPEDMLLAGAGKT